MLTEAPRWRTYVDVLRDLAFLVSAADGLAERVGLVRFYVRQFLWNVGIGARQDVVVRFRGSAYVVAQSIELHAMAEVHRDECYSRHADFLPVAGRTVVDVGGNIGVFAIFHASRGARVLSIEPNPDAYRRLEATVAANGFDARVNALNVAVGARNGTGRLAVPSGLSVLGAVSPVDTCDPPDAGAIQMVTLDELLADRGWRSVDVLKVDVEGGEADVLRGAASALAGVRRVVLEYHTPDLLAECRALLAESGLHEVEEVPTSPAIGMLYAAR
jgi:FkbM family methyltransferase